MNRRGSSTVKIILGIALGIVVCLVLAGYIWWKNTGSAMYDAVAGNMSEGRKVGLSITASGCVDTIIPRHVAAVASRPPVIDTSAAIKELMKGVVGESMFLSGCLLTAKPSPELCAAVPPSSDRERARVWAREQCEQRHASDAGCPALLLGPLQAYCGRMAKSTGSSG